MYIKVNNCVCLVYELILLVCILIVYDLNIMFLILSIYGLEFLLNFFFVLNIYLYKICLLDLIGLVFYRSGLILLYVFLNYVWFWLGKYLCGLNLSVNSEKVWVK